MHEVAAVVVSSDNYKTEVWCKCGFVSFQVNSYHDDSARKDFLKHAAQGTEL